MENSVSMEEAGVTALAHVRIYLTSICSGTEACARVDDIFAPASTKLPTATASPPLAFQPFLRKLTAKHLMSLTY